MERVVGYLSDDVCRILKITPAEDRNIYLGETNIIHIKKNHEPDYELYGDYLESILAEPDYIRINPSDESIEFVKRLEDDVKVAIRLASYGKYYVRSFYITSKRRNETMIKNGELRKFYKKIDK